MISIAFEDVSSSTIVDFSVEIGSTSYATVSAGSIHRDSGVSNARISSSGGPVKVANLGSAASELCGIVTLQKMDDNEWTVSSNLGSSAVEEIFHGGGVIDLGGVADRLKISIPSGALDSGKITIAAYS